MLLVWKVCVSCFFYLAVCVGWLFIALSTALSIAMKWKNQEKSLRTYLRKMYFCKGETCVAKMLFNFME